MITQKLLVSRNRSLLYKKTQPKVAYMYVNAKNPVFTHARVRLAVVNIS